MQQLFSFPHWHQGKKETPVYKGLRLTSEGLASGCEDESLWKKNFHRLLLSHLGQLGFTERKGISAKAIKRESKQQMTNFSATN